jgi:hypothetical protein
VAAIKAQWTSPENHLSESLRNAAADLLTENEANELAERRKSLEAERKRRQDEFQRAEAARLQQIAEAREAQQKAEAAKLKAISDQRANQQRVKDEEFRQLVAEMSVLGFTHSAQVSRYIVRNRLGRKYRYISGILEMELDGRVWDFNGGFPTDIYARLCEALGLEDQGSRAVPTKFTPYDEIFKH